MNKESKRTLSIKGQGLSTKNRIALNNGDQGLRIKNFHKRPTTLLGAIRP
jgi:hypothetical protein